MKKIYKSKLFVIVTIFLAHNVVGNDDLHMLFDYAIKLHKNNKLQAAITMYRRLLAQFPNFTTAQYNLGHALRTSGNIYEAIPELESVISKEPNNVSAHICLARAQLTSGNYLNGWAELEWRFGKQTTWSQKLRMYLKKHGTLADKTILIRAEWGLGDTMMFIRYAKLLKDLGATVIVDVQKSLIPLLSLCPYIDEIVDHTKGIPPFHFQIPMISLPVIFETTLDTIPVPVPYLYAQKNLVKEWRKKLGEQDHFKIGICWEGNIIHAAGKFMPLQQFLTLAQIPNVRLYSLQQRHGLDQLKDIPKQLLHRFDDDFDKTNGSFVDTAAVMLNLDLIITVDTSLAHLAGALGVPVWVVLPHVADWRWMLDRSDCPWHPTMRLFRQPKPNNWSSVAQAIKTKLTYILKKNNKRGIL